MYKLPVRQVAAGPQQRNKTYISKNLVHNPLSTSVANDYELENDEWHGQKCEVTIRVLHVDYYYERKDQVHHDFFRSGQKSIQEGGWNVFDSDGSHSL